MSPSAPFRTTVWSRPRPQAVLQLLAVALLAAGAVVAAAGPAAAGTLGCGDIITVGARLGSELIDCPDEGLVIGADDITLDLDGHTIDGDGISPVTCPVEGQACDVGVDNSAGHSGVTVQGGSIQQFNAGVLVSGGAEGQRPRRVSLSPPPSEGHGVGGPAHPRLE